MSEDFDKKIKLLIKSEKTLLNLELQRKTKQFSLVLIGLFIGLITLVMVNITSYFYLITKMTNYESTAILTVINLTLAVVILMRGFKEEKNPQVENVEEIRDYALAEVSKEVFSVKKNIESKIESINLGDTLGINKLLPLVTFGIDLYKKRAKK